MMNTTAAPASKTFKTPLFKDLSDEALIQEFISWRQITANWDRMATGNQSPRTRSKIAGGVLRGLRNVDIIIAIARRRGLQLPVL